MWRSQRDSQVLKACLPTSAGYGQEFATRQYLQRDSSFSSISSQEKSRHIVALDRVACKSQSISICPSDKLYRMKYSQQQHLSILFSLFRSYFTRENSHSGDRIIGWEALHIVRFFPERFMNRLGICGEKIPHGDPVPR